LAHDLGQRCANFVRKCSAFAGDNLGDLQVYAVGVVVYYPIVALGKTASESVKLLLFKVIELYCEVTIG
jgi:hypothetical protein